MDQFLAMTLIGVIATAAMTLFLWILTGLRLADVDMVRAIGSLATRSVDRALGPGLAIHFVVGIALSYFYLYVIQIPDPLSLRGYTWVGLFLGFMHGLVVSIALVVLVAEHHPIARFQKAGFQVALLHLVAHVIYGATIGMLAGLWKLGFIAA